MVIYWVIYIFVALLALYDWKKTVIGWIPFSMLFNDAVRLKFDKPAITLELAVDLTLLLLFYLSRQKKSREEYIFKWAFIAYLISYALSFIYASVPYGTAINGTIKYFITTFIVIYLFHCALQTRKDILFFFKCLKMSLVIIIIYAMIEVILRTNPVLNYIYYTSPSPSLIAHSFYYNPSHSSIRFGMVRCYSLFAIHINFGCACAMWLFLLLFINKYVKILRTSFTPIVIFLCIIGVFLSNSKTPVIGLLFFTFSILNPSTLLNAKIIVPFILMFAAVAIIMPGSINNLLALFDEDIAESGGGSNIEMRTMQYEIGLGLFEKNPILGNGVGAISYFMKFRENSLLLGSESSFLKILPERGIIGLIVYFLLYIFTYLKMYKISGIQMTALFLGGILAMEIATGFMAFTIWGAIVIAILRMYNLGMVRRR